jgi:hypothetical protein
MPLTSPTHHRLRHLIHAAGVALCLTATASAQDAPAPEASPEPAASPAPAPGVDVSGFVDAYYMYNFNKVDPALRTFDVQHNAFSLSLAEIAFQKTATADSKGGFRVDLDFGKTADLVAAYEPEGSDGKEIYKHIQQAYVSYFASPKVTLDFGKFVTPIGAEVIESKDNWNYARSFLFGYAIPFYHVGLRGTITASDKVTLTGFVLNGWNNSSEIFQGQPCLAVGATVKPTGSITWIGNFMYGPEHADSDVKRSLFDTTLTVMPKSNLSLMGNFNYGKDGDAGLGPGRPLRVRRRLEGRLHDTRPEGADVHRDERSQAPRRRHPPAGVLPQLGEGAVLREFHRRSQEVTIDAYRRSGLCFRRQDLAVNCGAPANPAPLRLPQGGY